MSALVGIRHQKFKDRLYDASGTITTGGTAQLILPQANARSSLILENISDTNMYFEFGSGRATCTILNGTVNSVSITNAGFGFSIEPTITFFGGCWDQKGTLIPTYALSGTPDFTGPDSSAKAHCVMTGNAPNMTISSIVIDNGGSGYTYPPYVFIGNRSIDPFGCAIPSVTSGILLLPSGGSYTPNGSVCTTDQISVFCATTGKAYTCKYTL